MLRRSRCGVLSAGIVLGFSLCLFAFWLSSDNRIWDLDGPHKQQSTYAEKRCAEYELQHARPAPLDLPSEEAAPAEKRASKTTNQQDEEPNWCDLAAQQSMANSTRGMEWAAWATVGLSFVGVILLGFTLLYTKETLGEANATARHARRQADDAERFGRLQNAAYLSFVEGKCVILNNTPIFEIVVKNDGNSPAINAGVQFARVNCDFRETNSTDELLIQHREYVGSIAPKGTHTIRMSNDMWDFLDFGHREFIDKAEYDLEIDFQIFWFDKTETKHLLRIQATTKTLGFYEGDGENWQIAPKALFLISSNYGDETS